LGDENGIQNIDVESLTKLIGTAKGVALVNVIKRVKGGNKLTAHELDLLNEIERKISSQQDNGPAKKQVIDTEREFENLMEVLGYLKEEKGYKVSKSKIYEDQQKGMIHPDNGKKYTLKIVQAYARHLVLEKTRKKKKAGELYEKKLKLEIEIQEEDLAFKRFKRLKDEGKYIDKDKADLRIASALSIVEAELIGAFQIHAGDLTVTVAGGDEKNAPAMERETTAIILQTLNGLANMKEHQVDF
jgi:hypothetical protein